MHVAFCLIDDRAQTCGYKNIIYILKAHWTDNCQEILVVYYGVLRQSPDLCHFGVLYLCHVTLTISLDIQIKWRSRLALFKSNPMIMHDTRS